MPPTASGYRLAAIVASCFFGVLACEPDAPPANPSRAPPRQNSGKKPPITVYAGAPGFCLREGADAVRDVFCGEEPPEIRSLSDLQSALGMGFASTDSYDNASSGVVGLADGTVSVILSHSTALGGDLVSPINPRVILIGGGSLLAFNRGAQQVEIDERSSEDDAFLEHAAQAGMVPPRYR